MWLVYCVSVRTTVTKRGQVSVPAEVRKKLQIGPSTELEWVVEGATVRVIPLPVDPVKAFRGSGKKGNFRFRYILICCGHACGYKLANDGQDTRAVQHYLGHKNIQHTVRYTELSPDRFKSFWDD